MASIKTSELSGSALAYAVAVADGRDPKLSGRTFWTTRGGPSLLITEWTDPISYAPHIKWDQGGPIIVKIGGFQLKIRLESTANTKCEARIHGHGPTENYVAFGPTPLIAAMRAYVAWKLGEEVEVPEELLCDKD